MGRMFIGGNSTRIEVKSLMKLDIAAGIGISYETVETISHVSRDTPRFRTVSNVWRKRVFRERGLQSTAENGNFIFLTADQAQDHAHSYVKRIGRATGRLVMNVGAIRSEDLTTEVRKAKQMLMAREADALLAAAQASAKRIVGPKPIDGDSVRMSP